MKRGAVAALARHDLEPPRSKERGPVEAKNAFPHPQPLARLRARKSAAPLKHLELKGEKVGKLGLRARKSVVLLKQGDCAAYNWLVASLRARKSAAPLKRAGC